jgi:hypothetical protein
MAMQLTLCGVLAASFGVAALVDHALGSSAVALGADQHKGPLHFRLPADWHVAYASADDPRIVGIAEEAKQPERAITIFSQPIRPLLPPWNYLQQSGLAEEIFGSAEPEQIGPAVLAGARAVVLSGRTLVGEGDQSRLETELVICCVFPNHLAVTVWMSKSGQLTPADRDLVRQVQGSVKMDAAGTTAEQSQ